MDRFLFDSVFDCTLRLLSIFLSALFLFALSVFLLADPFIFVILCVNIFVSTSPFFCHYFCHYFWQHIGLFLAMFLAVLPVFVGSICSEGSDCAIFYACKCLFQGRPSPTAWGSWARPAPHICLSGSKNVVMLLLRDFV